MDGKAQLNGDDFVYTGEVHSMVYHGKGKLEMFFEDHRNRQKHVLWTYEGDFAQGAKHGRGTEVNSRGWTCEGEWVQDDFVLGKMLHSDGDVFEGSFRNYRPHGRCTYTRLDGQSQCGEWKHGQFESGDACFRFPNGGKYVGKCVGELMHGWGTMFLPDGRIITVNPVSCL